MRILYGIMLYCLMAVTIAGGAFEVERERNNREYTINGQRFEALTSCSGIAQGDRVTFIEGNAEGDCKTAKIINIRNGARCDLWCR